MAKHHTTRAMHGCVILESIVSNSKHRHRLKSDLARWADDLSNYSSLHGVAWFGRTENHFLKAYIFSTSLAIVVALPAYLAYQLVLYNADVSVINAVEWRRAETVVYPNITVCHSKYFDVRKLDSKHHLGRNTMLAISPLSKASTSRTRRPTT